MRDKDVSYALYYGNGPMAEAYRRSLELKALSRDLRELWMSKIPTRSLTDYQPTR